MTLKFTFLPLFSLAALASCAPATEPGEPVAYARPDEVTAFFGEDITYRKGRQTAAEPKGTYLEVAVHDDKLAQQYGGDLSLPASNCAYLSYKNLPAAERSQYNYLKITMQDGLTPSSFDFPAPELAQATRAAADLDTLMTLFKDRNYPAVVNTFNASAITPTMRAQLPADLATIEQKMGPVQQYYLEGYAPVQEQVAGKKQALVRLFVTLSHPQKASRALVVVDPARRPREPFLYGLNLLN
jgi:hypothetical protein